MKLLCASAVFITLLSSCASQPTIKAAYMPTPRSKVSDSNTVNLTRHIISGYGRVVWEAGGDNFDIFFEHGTIDGYITLTEAENCKLFEFSIYNIEEKSGKTNIFTINNLYFERLKNSKEDGIQENIYFPYEYSKEMAARVFASADSVLIAFDKIEEEISYGKLPHETTRHNNPNGPHLLRHNQLLKIRDKCAKEITLIDTLLIEKILHYAILQLQ